MKKRSCRMGIAFVSAVLMALGMSMAAPAECVPLGMAVSAEDITDENEAIALKQLYSVKKEKTEVTNDTINVEIGSIRLKECEDEFVNGIFWCSVDDYNNVLNEDTVISIITYGCDLNDDGTYTEWGEGAIGWTTSLLPIPATGDYAGYGWGLIYDNIMYDKYCTEVHLGDECYTKVYYTIDKVTGVELGYEHAEGDGDLYFGNEDFPDSCFAEHLYDNFDINKDRILSESEISAVGVIDVSGESPYDLGKITSLKGIEYFKNLYKLSCKFNTISELDLSSNTSLQALHCEVNQLESLDVSNNALLNTLNCSENKLSVLDVSNNVELETLWCGVNQLGVLDISNNAKLLSLWCGDNQLTQLDVKNNTLLHELMCGGNNLENIDVSKNTNLTTFNCDRNLLQDVDVSNNAKLHQFFCYENQLTSLDVSRNTALTDLDCNGNIYVISTTNNKFDLSLLSGFDASKASNWIGAVYNESDNTITVNSETVTYDYDCGNGKTVKFTLTTDYVAPTVAVDEVNFPDEIFRKYVSDNFDTDKDGKLSRSECDAVLSIYVTYKNIQSIKGIEYFTKLRSLYCYSNQLTSLDVSKNTALTSLDCSFNQITSLDVSKNTALISLNCGINQLKNLDVNNNTALKSLICNINQLTSLDVSKNIVLSLLYCDTNQLTNVDVSNNIALTQLRCSYNQLTSLDVSHNTDLTILECYNNQLTNLDLSNNTAITELKCDNNTYAISTTNNKFNLSSLNGFDASKASNWSGAVYNAVDNTITINNDIVSYKYDCGNGETITFTLTTDYVASIVATIDEANFPDVTFRQYVLDNFDTNKDGYLYDCEINAVTKINVSAKSDNPKSIQSLKGIEYFTALETLWCFDNQLTSLDISKNTALTYLFCHNNKLTSLNVQNNTALVNLVCNNNQLTNIDVSQNSLLEMINCTDNLLTALDLSNNPKLKQINCDNNLISKLNISGYEQLKHLQCRNNKLTKLIVSGNPSLEQIFCDDNQLTCLDVSGNEKLTALSCPNNQLSEIICGNTLTVLICDNNKLTELDVSGYDKLVNLQCNDNQLTNLNVSKNTALKWLKCNNNQLASLDLSNNTAITELKCDNNIYVISTTNNKFNLSSLNGFDASKASDWSGAVFNESDNTITITANTVTYTYDCGNGHSVTFTLTVSDNMDISDCINAVNALYNEGGDVIILNELQLKMIEAVLEYDNA